MKNPWLEKKMLDEEFPAVWRRFRELVLEAIEKEIDRAEDEFERALEEREIEK